MSPGKLLLSLLALFVAGTAMADFEEDEAARSWQESEVQYPAPPSSAALLAFSPGAATDNRFFVDGASLSVGSDGVVRYTLLVLSPEGGRNVSYEGMRCETKERRIYATGRADGSWSISRVKQWARVRDAVGNRHYAALFLEYFCPMGVIVRSADEARDALKRGGHKDIFSR